MPLDPPMRRVVCGGGEDIVITLIRYGLCSKQVAKDSLSLFMHFHFLRVRGVCGRGGGFEHSRSWFCVYLLCEPFRTKPRPRLLALFSSFLFAVNELVH